MERVNKEIKRRYLSETSMGDLDTIKTPTPQIEEVVPIPELATA